MAWSLVALLWLPLGAAQEAEEEALTAEQGAAAERRGVLVYRPPLRGRTQFRLRTGTRGDEQMPIVQVLAPEGVGLTTRLQPTLYWYTSQPVERARFTLIDDDDPAAIDPLLDVELGPSPAGIQRIDLAAYGLRLTFDRTYLWSITIPGDPRFPSSDGFASGGLMPVAAASPPTSIDPWAHLQRLAAAGLWYDLIALLSRLIDEQPQAKAWQAQRQQLLVQVGLTDIQP